MTIDLRLALSEADCKSSDLREFYDRHLEKVGTVVFRPGKQFKGALALQPKDETDGVWYSILQKNPNAISFF
jgi:hypothetical protein